MQSHWKHTGEWVPLRWYHLYIQLYNSRKSRSLLWSLRNEVHDQDVFNRHADHGVPTTRLRRHWLWIMIIIVQVIPCLVQFGKTELVVKLQRNKWNLALQRRIGHNDNNTMTQESLVIRDTVVRVPWMMFFWSHAVWRTFRPPQVVQDFFHMLVNMQYIYIYNKVSNPLVVFHPKNSITQCNQTTWWLWWL